MQDALQLHILVTLKANADVQALLQCKRFQESLAQHQDLVRLLSESEHRYASTMAAIQQLPARIKFKQTLAGLEHLHLTDPAHSSRLSHREKLDQPEIQYTSQQEAQARASVLDHLRFRQMKLREHEVSEAHQRTFNWIFDKPSKSGDNFAHWLRDGTGFLLDERKSSFRQIDVNEIRCPRQSNFERLEPMGRFFVCTYSVFFLLALGYIPTKVPGRSLSIYTLRSAIEARDADP